MVTHSASVEDAGKVARSFTLEGLMPKVKCPLLIVHSQGDMVCDYRDAERMAREAGGPVELKLYPDGNHVCDNIPYKVRPLMADWLARQLGLSASWWRLEEGLADAANGFGVDDAARRHRDAGLRRRGRGFLCRQADQVHHPHRLLHLLQFLLAAFGAPHRPAHSGQPERHRREHAGRRRHPRRHLCRQGRAAGRHDPVDRKPGPAGRPGVGLEYDVPGRPARLPLDRQYLVVQPGAGHLAYLADQDARRSHEARNSDRIEPGRLDLNATAGRAQQYRRHQDQNRLRLSGRRRYQHRDGARRGRRPCCQSVGELCRQPVRTTSRRN